MSTSMTLAGVGRRRRWTAAEKTACLRAFAASGQSAAAFCRERGVPRATLTLWRRTAGVTPPRPQPSGEAAPLARFAQVEVVGPPAPLARQEITTAAPPVCLELTLALRAPDGLEAVVTGLDAPAAVAVLRGVLAPLAPAVAGGA